MKEAWQMILRKEGKASKGTINCWNQMYNKKVITKKWQKSEAVQIGKNNGKNKCKAIRLINKLDAAGKMWFKTIWKTARPAATDFSYGFLKYRRREQAILVQNIMTWRLRSSKYSHITSFHDVANAFPSISTQTLDEMVEKQLNRTIKQYLKQDIQKAK